MVDAILKFTIRETLLLSVGLIPENELSRAEELEISPITNGPDGRKVPEGFCTWAWADIFKDIIFVRNNMELAQKVRSLKLPVVLMVLGQLFF